MRMGERTSDKDEPVGRARSFGRTQSCLAPNSGVGRFTFANELSVPACAAGFSTPRLKTNRVKVVVHTISGFRAKIRVMYSHRLEPALLEPPLLI